MPTITSASPQLQDTELCRSDSGTVTLERAAKRAFTAVKTSRHRFGGKLIARKVAIHGNLKHPFIIVFHEFSSESGPVVSEFAGNVALSDHLPVAQNHGVLGDPNRIARIVVAMDHLHSQGVVHGNLRPDKALVD
jgi:serine/threonine protein kinase